MTEYDATGTVYQVAEHIPGEEDEDWYEYRVFLFRGETLVDEWDSLAETYNGVKGQRLDYREAQAAVEEVIEGVQEGNAENWFNI